MDQIKIGKFINKKRKEKKLTQSELASKLLISDRAVSKWENGKCMPDYGIIKELCEILNITINDLFSGEVVDMKDSEKRLEENLLEMTKLKQEKDKQLLNLEILIGALATIIVLICVYVGSYFEMKDLYRILIISMGFIIFIISASYCLRIEQVAGYYKCKKCNHKYIPTYINIFLAMHFGRTRYLKCPKCGKYSWNKKVIEK